MEHRAIAKQMLEESAPTIPRNPAAKATTAKYNPRTATAQTDRKKLFHIGEGTIAAPCMKNELRNGPKKMFWNSVYAAVQNSDA